MQVFREMEDGQFYVIPSWAYFSTREAAVQSAQEIIEKYEDAIHTLDLIRVTEENVELILYKATPSESGN